MSLWLLGADVYAQVLTLPKVYSAPAMACPPELDAIRGMDSNMRDLRAPSNNPSICNNEERQRTTVEFSQAAMEHSQENSTISQEAPAHKLRTSINSQHSNDSAIDLTEPSASTPVRPPLQRREKFTQDHVLRKRKHVQKEITKVSFLVSLPPKNSNDQQKLVNSVPQGHQRGTFEITLRPAWKTLSGYPIPSNWIITRPDDYQPAKKEPTLKFFAKVIEKKRQESLEKKLQELQEKERQDSLKKERRKMYTFFRQYYQCGQTPVDPEWFEREQSNKELMEMRNEAHAKHLRQE